MSNTLELIRAKAIIDRLSETVKVGGLVADVVGIGSMPEAYSLILRSPTLFALPPDRTASSNIAATGATVQTVTSTFRVLAGFTKIGARFGDDQSGPVEDVSAAVLGAIVGWTPDSASASPFQFVSSGLVELDFKAGAMLWAYEFSTRTHVRAT
jgi:hypothetical protein